jgi:gliding motility-associated-like protein
VDANWKKVLFLTMCKKKTLTCTSMFRFRTIITYAFCCWSYITSAQTPFVCKGQYYLSLTKSSSTPSQLYRILIDDSGTSISLDTISNDLTAVVNAMGYRITDNFIYGMDPYAATLSRIGSDGLAFPLGKPKGIPDTPIYFAGDVTPDGRFLLLIGLGSGTPQIVKVDLEDAEYSCTFVPLLDNSVSIVDIAFDPFSGELYGHDFRNDRLVIIDPNTGAVNSNFVKVPQVDQLGALFFDSFGNLYGYGSYGTSSQDKFVGINKRTGEMRLLAQGPPSTGQDGCACPYTMELQKTVTPDTTFECTEVIYNFIISNGSGALRPNIKLEDMMPKGLVPIKVVSNPFGGVETLIGNILKIENMSVNPGIDTIKVAVRVDKNSLGDYKNQAVLSGLPISLGETTFSDDPFTFLEKDSTLLHVLPIDLNFIVDSLNICAGDSTWYDVRRYGLSYKWDDGSTDGARFLVSPKDYKLTVTDACEEYIFDISVSSAYSSVNIEIDTLIINLGDSVVLDAVYQNPDNNVAFKWWSSRNDTEIECKDCQSTAVLPLYNCYVYVSMVNSDGCNVKDSVFLRVDKDYQIFAPNIISADGNNINDIFYISGNSKSASGQRLRIYDRWGNLVYDQGPFKLNDSSYGWDGVFRGSEVVLGVYAWTADILFIDKVVKNYFGDLTVIK